MTTTTKSPKTKTPVFPADAVRDCLRDELIAAVKDEAQRKGAPITGSPSHIAGISIFLDSLTVVETLCALDDVLPFQVDESVVRAGGYNSIVEAINHVTSRVEAEWKSYHEGTK